MVWAWAGSLRASPVPATSAARKAARIASLWRPLRSRTHLGRSSSVISLSRSCRDLWTHEAEGDDAGQLGLVGSVVDAAVLARSVDRFRAYGITLPTFAALADPSGIDPAHTAGADPGAAHPANLFRVHWFNDLAGERVDVPDHVVLPTALTGVE